jgi:hypothetical protein
MQLAPLGKARYTAGDTQQQYLNKLLEAPIPDRVFLLYELARWMLPTLDAELLAWCSIIYSRYPRPSIDPIVADHLKVCEKAPFRITPCLGEHYDSVLRCSTTSSHTPRFNDTVVGVGLTEPLLTISGKEIVVFPTESLAAFLAARIAERVSC